MRYFVISDNTDTQVGLRLAGVEGVVARSKEEAEKAIQKALADDTVGILLITESGRRHGGHSAHHREPGPAVCRPAGGLEDEWPHPAGGGDSRPTWSSQPRCHWPIHPGGHWYKIIGQHPTMSLARLCGNFTPQFRCAFLQYTKYCCKGAPHWDAKFARKSFLLNGVVQP